MLGYSELLSRQSIEMNIICKEKAKEVKFSLVRNKDKIFEKN